MAHRQPQPRPPIKSLNPKRQRFVAEYLIDLNATRAAMRAGYSQRTAEQQGYRLLRNVEVAAAVTGGQARIAAKLKCTADDVARELHKLGFANMLDYMVVGRDGGPRLDFSRLTREQAAALAEVPVDHYLGGRGEDARQVRRIRFKLADKRAALVDLAKLLGLTPERDEHTGKDGEPIGRVVIYLPDNGRGPRQAEERQGKGEELAQNPPGPTRAPVASQRWPQVPTLSRELGVSSATAHRRADPGKSGGVPNGNGPTLEGARQYPRGSLKAPLLASDLGRR